MQFDLASAGRIAVGVLQRERDGRGQRRRARPPAVALPLVAIRVTTAIKAATSAGPGLGYGQVVDLGFDGHDVATWGQPYGDTLPVYTLDTKTGTAAGLTIVCGYLGGRLMNILEICPS